jgi:YD repeat-containing protein
VRGAARKSRPYRDHEVAVNDAAGPTVSGHDEVESLLKFRHASGNVIQFSYDRLSRRTSETDPFGKQLKCEYDFAGNLTRITDRYGPNGRKYLGRHAK